VTIEDVEMTWPMRDFELASQLAMHAATAVVLLIKSLFRRGRHRRSSNL
jgi:hypothetical protein